MTGRSNRWMLPGRGAAAGVILLALVGLLSGVAACSSAQRYQRVQLGGPGQMQLASTVEGTRAPLRVAVAGVISPKETYKSYQELLDYLGSQLDRPVELIQRKSYGEINDLIRSGGIDLAFVCALPYVQGQQEFGLELLAAPQVRGEALYRSYIIVPADRAVERLEQLQGKMYAFTDPDSNSGRLVPTYLLRQMGQTPEGFFGKLVFTYSHDNSIKAVADKLVDGASVDSLVYDYLMARDPQMVRRTRVIWRSEPFGSPPAVVHPRMPKDLKESLREALVGMNEDPRGRAILERLMIDRFVAADEAAYEPVRRMWRAVRGLP